MTVTSATARLPAGGLGANEIDGIIGVAGIVVDILVGLGAEQSEVRGQLRGALLASPAPLEVGGPEAVGVAAAAADEACVAGVLARSGREHARLDAVGDDGQGLRPPRQEGFIDLQGGR